MSNFRQVIRKLFSIRNCYRHGEKIKVLEFLGFKIKLYTKHTDKKNKTENKIFLSQLTAIYNENFTWEIRDYSATVVIPVYNGFDHVQELIHHIFKNTNKSIKFIFINDCSTDERIDNILSGMPNNSNIIYIKNDKNLGFTKTVNKAMSLVDTDYAIWVNTDVVVPPLWVERILEPFYNNKKIASITPFTNSGVFFSFPCFGEDNALVDGFSLEEIDNSFKKIKPDITPEHEIHAGCGFCMAIDMRCWKEIGSLDDINFDRGYGEECDWCQRAVKAGWKNILVPNLFVYHKHGGSFVSEEKKKLMNDHYNILKEKHPNLERDVHKFATKDYWKPIRTLAALNMSDADCSKEAYIWIDINTTGGGACAYRDHKIKEFQKNGKNVIWVAYSIGDDTLWTIKLPYVENITDITMQNISDLDFILNNYRIEKIIVANLAFCESVFDVLNYLITKHKDKNITCLFHDYFCICPSFFLLDKSGSFCNIDKNKCNNDCICGSPFTCVKKYRDLHVWRGTWASFFACVDEFCFFSETTKGLVSKVYPAAQKGIVIEHAPLSEFDAEYIYPKDDDQINIAFVGSFIKEKGSEYAKKVAIYIKNNNINANIHVFGESYDDFSDIKFHGRYKRDDLPNILTKYKIKMVMFLSPLPETFSYVVQECMMMKIPFVLFDIGAPAERVKKYKYPYAQFIEKYDAESIVNAILELEQRMRAIKI